MFRRVMGWVLAKRIRLVLTIVATAIVIAIVSCTYTSTLAPIEGSLKVSTTPR
jgi:hypothetical protein